jgi:predicted tellurium resistance membrane protein TerC
VISIPLIIFGSAIILKLMTRFPIIVTLGAALLGFVAGEMALTDPAITGWTNDQHLLHTVLPIAAAIGVVMFGKWLISRRGAAASHQVAA